MQGDLFWKLDTLSDPALLDGLNRIVGRGRRALAELIAHLCEVENRRLHLDAGYPSMFAYCVARLGLGEDEASRRIDVARLARRAPVVFTLIAEGRLSLSVAALLKPHLLAPNLTELIDAVSGKTIRAAQEALVTFYPRADVSASVRKLPEPAADSRAMLARSPSLFEQPTSPSSEQAPMLTPSPRPKPSRPLEPLSPGRYKIQFTASVALKQNIELARDLSRHTIPSGDLGAIVERALELLVADLMKKRFGAGVRERATSHPTAPSKIDTASPAPAHVPRTTQRAVLERDGLRCTWRGPDGVRCTARAWLERDHRQPRALGGGSGPENVRHLCRAHNRRAAEHIFGERHMRRMSDRRLDENESPTLTHPPNMRPPIDLT